LPNWSEIYDGITRKQKHRAVAAYASLAGAVYSLDSLLDQQCVSFGLSPGQFRVLENLLLSGPMTPRSLGERLLRHDSTLTKILGRIEKAGLVARRAHEKDRRSVTMHLTPKGRNLIERILPKRAKVIHARMSVLSKRDQETLERLCDKLAKGDPAKFVLKMTVLDEEED
jgi:DNA-binding MarR family transcriptional regulator